MERVQIYGIVLLVIGAAMRYWVNRRRFNRRTITGIQVFSNYEKAVTLTYFEKLVKLAGLLILGFGILLIASGII
jgi:hypothetical protein